MLEFDLKIIIVQVVTFLIGIFVLWRIGWKPLMNMLTKRKEDIAKTISDAQNLKLETEKLKKDYEQMISGINKRAQDLIQKANEAGDENAQKIIMQARDEAKNIVDTARKQLEAEKEKVKSDLKKEIVPIAISIAEKITGSMIDKNIKKDLIEKFLEDASKQ